MNTLELTLPDFWASALINGDESGLNNEDLEILNKFVDDMVREFGMCHCMDIKEDSSFTRRHDAYGVLACNASTYVFDITKRGA